MKKKLLSRYTAILAGLLSLGSLPLLAADVSIEYDQPEKFSDIGENRQFDKSTFASFKSTMEEAFQTVADRYLKDGESLEVTFYDVDLAGESEPWHRPELQNVRVVRSIYPPRVKFHYLVTGASGEKKTEGTAQLTDSAFTWNIGASNTLSRAFVYETDLIETWGRRVLRDFDTSES